MKKKLVVVRNSHKAAQVQAQLGDDWMVIGYGAVLAGYCFDQIFFIDQPTNSDVERKKYEKIKKLLKLKLTPNGTLTELY